MAKLDSLKVNAVPAAFAEIAAKHNALVGLIANMKGVGGIDIHIPDFTPKTKLSVPRKMSGTLPKRDYNGNIMVSLPAPTPPLPSGTQELHYNDGTVQIDIDANGVKVTQVSSGNYMQMMKIGQFAITNVTTTKSLLIDPADITQTMGVKVIQVCSGGVTKNMKIVASDPY